MGFQFNWRERIFDRSVKLTKSVFPIRCNMLFYVQSSHYFWKCVTLSISNYQYRYHNQYQSFTPTFSTSSTPIVSRHACTIWRRKWIIKSTHTHTEYNPHKNCIAQWNCCATLLLLLLRMPIIFSVYVHNRPLLVTLFYYWNNLLNQSRTNLSLYFHDFHISFENEQIDNVYNFHCHHCCPHHFTHHKILVHFNYLIQLNMLIIFNLACVLFDLGNELL